MNGREIKISQYADDTTLILDGHKRSFDTSLKGLDMFSEIARLCLNRKKKKKPEALWIGAKASSEDKLCPETELK